MAYPYTIPDLEDRFLPPDNWHCDEFTNPETGHNIHYASLQAPMNIKGTVCALPGLSEFTEKYIETAKFFTNHGYDFHVIDWAYQGRSSRLKRNPHKRHSDSYNTDISDLHFFIKNIIKPEIPLFMLGHSMGGNIGLRYIDQHPSVFKAAAFSAPMLGIEDLKKYYPLIKIILSILRKFLGESYVPGGKNWHKEARNSDGTDIFSNDKIRDSIHNIWCLSNPELQVGNPTFLWLWESLKSINTIETSTSNINIPVLFALADKERLVDNNAIRKISSVLKNSKLLELKNCKHEILMETDEVRDVFLKKTLDLFNESI